jgi:hypothetical protein
MTSNTYVCTQQQTAKTYESPRREVITMVYKLPVFRGYTVDERLRQFRKVDVSKGIESIPFDSHKGQRLLAAYQAAAVWMKIASDPNEPDWWICLCGNRPDLDGFYPCHQSGEIIGPTPIQWPSSYYRCDRCGRVIQAGTRTIVGIADDYILDRETLGASQKPKP